MWPIVWTLPPDNRTHKTVRVDPFSYIDNILVLTITIRSSEVGPRATRVSGLSSGLSYLNVVLATSKDLGHSMNHSALMWYSPLADFKASIKRKESDNRYQRRGRIISIKDVSNLLEILCSNCVEEINPKRRETHHTG